ncbi:MAG: PAS domain S-box protein [Magnetococcales bacterium]|nr:PAS domain S-box protein [Magnetococcales bacterium]
MEPTPLAKVAGKTIAILGGSGVIVLGLMVLAGWHFHHSGWIQVHPDLVPMQYNTALGFVLSGGGLLALLSGKIGLSRTLATAALILAGLTLLEYLIPIDLGLDQLFMKHYILLKTSHPGRMAPNAALCFALSATALLIGGFHETKNTANRMVGIIGGVVIALGAVALIGYPFQLEAAYGWGDMTRMALHTASAFVLLGLGLTALAWYQEPDRSVFFPPWFPNSIGLGTATVTLALWNALHTLRLQSDDPFNSLYPNVHHALLIFGLLLSWALALTIHFYLMARRKTVALQREQQALKASEQKFLQLFMEMSIPLGYVDKNGIVLHANRRFSRLLGYTTNDVPTLNDWWPRAYPDPQYRRQVIDSWSAAVRKAMAEGTDISPIEYDVTCKNGTVKTIEIGGTTFGEDLLATFVDVTERKKFETQVLNERLFSDSIIESLSGLFYLFDQKGHLVRCNRNFLEVTGYSREEISGKHALEFIAAGDREKIASSIEEVFLHGHATTEAHLSTRNGRTIPYLFSGTRIEISRAYYLTGIGLDMTERKQLDQELRSARIQAEEANHAKSRFLATMSHEIRTPLNTIIGMGDMLTESVTTPEQKQFLAALHRASASLLALVNDILDLSKIEAGEMILESMPFHLTALLNDTLQILALQARDKGLTLEIKIANNVPAQCQGDPQRLRQILLNLLGNAIKFTDKGHVKLEVRLERSGRILFAVSDTGRGINDENQERIFQPFTQEDNTVTRRHGGTGLGLAICRQLVAAMGGRIWVESERGQGSTFFFLIPLHPVTETIAPAADDGSPPTDSETVEPLSAHATHSRILLAEDAEENQMVITAYLKGTRYSVEIAANGAQALKKFKEGDFGAVLMDVQMPIMDGYVATRMIRQWEAGNGLRHTPIIALTANAMREDAQRVLEAGCDLHLSKPIRKSRLIEVLDALVS